jgi:glycerol uptake facilitator-like aquaporin
VTQPGEVLSMFLELNLAIPVMAVGPFVLESWIDNEALLWRTMCFGTLSVAVWASVVFSARTRPFRAATSIPVRRSLQSFGVMTFLLSLVGVFSDSPPRAMACFLTALGLALMISGAFFALVTPVAFNLARQREPQVGTRRMGEIGTG